VPVPHFPTAFLLLLSLNIPLVLRRLIVIISVAFLRFSFMLRLYSALGTLAVIDLCRMPRQQMILAVFSFSLCHCLYS